MPPTRDLRMQQAELQDALLKLRAERSLRSFVEQAWPILEPAVPFLSNWHIDYLVEHGKHVCGRRLLSSGVSSDHRDLAVSAHRNCVWKELPVLRQHLLGERQGRVQKFIQVRLALRGGRVSPGTHWSIMRDAPAK